MKTTDSVMREKRDIEKKFYEDLADNEWILDDPYSPDMVQMPFHELEKRVHALLSHSLAEARREWDSKAEKARKFAVLPDPNPYGKWVSVKNHNRVVNQALDLLTGDNPERKV